MIREEIKKNLFKTKRINDEIGILSPLYIENSQKFSDTQIVFNKLSNVSQYSNIIDYEKHKDIIKVAKLNKEEEEISKKIIVELKEIYKKQKHYIKQYTKYKNKLEELKKQMENEKLEHINNISNLHKDICSLKGFISIKDFEDIITKLKISKHYFANSGQYNTKIDIITDKDNIVGIKLIQQWQSKEYANDNDYDFLIYSSEDEEEYGCELELDIDLAKIKANKSKDYNNIVEEFIDMDENLFEDSKIEKEIKFLLGDNDVVIFNHSTNILFKNSKSFTKETYEYIAAKIKKINSVY